MMFPTVCAVIWLTIMASHGGLAEIKLDPSNLRLDDGNTDHSVQVSCLVPSNLLVQFVYSMLISRNTSSQPTREQILAVGDASSPGKVTLTPPSEGGLAANSATVTGGTGVKSIVLTLTQVYWNDAGVYRCLIYCNYGSGTNIKKIDDYQNLTVRAGLAMIQLNPSNLRLDEVPGRLEVSCEFPKEMPVTSVFLMRLTRKTTRSPSVEQPLAMANALSGKNSGLAVLVPSSEGGLSADMAIVSGSTTNKTIQLILTKVSCQDTGTYYCYISYSAGAEHDQMEYIINGYQNLTVSAIPGDITVTADPGGGFYTIGTTVRLSCSGVLGSYKMDGNEPWYWSWEYQKNLTTAWVPVEKDTVNSVSSSVCQVSALTHIVTRGYSKITYRCTAHGNSKTLSATFTITAFSSASSLGYSFKAVSVITTSCVICNWFWRQLKK